MKFLTIQLLLKVVLTTLFFAIGFNQANAQFEQKLTINGSGAVAIPEITNENTNYSIGIGAEGGLQYNFNRHFSSIANARFFYHFGTPEYPDAYFQNIGIGVGLKANILPSKKVNPYVFAEANINLLWEEDWVSYNEPYPRDRNGNFIFEELIENSGFSIGGLGGAGIDFKLNDNLALFVQSGAYYIYWNTSVNIYSQAGVRINLLKSKTL